MKFFGDTIYNPEWDGYIAFKVGNHKNPFDSWINPEYYNRWNDGYRKAAREAKQETKVLRLIKI